MATLYTQAEKNVRKTWILMTSFLIFVIFLGWIFARVFNSPAILYFAVFLAFFQSFVSYWYSDKIVLAMTGAKPTASPFRGKQSTNWFAKLFMTHPPIEERIKVLREMSI